MAAVAPGSIGCRRLPHHPHGESRVSQRPILESRIPWPRGRFWRPGELITLPQAGSSTTYRLRGVMRDADPDSEYATVLLEPVAAAGAAAGDDPEDELVSAVV
jgi:hypothetical protein